TSTPSSSGRPRSPPATTARTTACRTPNGCPPGTRRSNDGYRRTSRAWSPVTAATAPAPGDQRRDGTWSRLSAALWRRPWARAPLLLTPPLAWFVLIYLAALVVLLITAFWQINPFTTNIERVWSLTNFSTIFGGSAYRAIIGR